MAYRTVPDFQAEIWSLYSIATCFTVLRFVARVKSVGFRGLKHDDFLVLLAMLPFTALTAIAHRGGTLYYSTRNPPRIASPSLPMPGQPGHSIWLAGMKLHFASWNVYIATLWLLKASLLVLYRRMTFGLARTYRIRNLVGWGLVAASWGAAMFTMYLACRPFGRYFQSFPPPPNYCQPAVSKPVIWVCYTGNVLTDLYLITIPLPLLWSVKLPIWKRSGLALLFSGGIIIIAFATVRCALITVDPRNGAPLSGTWAVRETFVAIITANTPMAFTLVKGLLGLAFKSARSSDDTPGLPLETNGDSMKHSIRMQAVNGRQTLTNMIFTESEERIVKGTESPPEEPQSRQLDVENTVALRSY